ncbi:MAG: peptide chain release factor N(5)-glutamine methyltransferase [Eubacteriales bacterium]|nr:peptide chain release factor N(5)-glutamine methyltransferase [Eubacteriales bacterium]
MTLKEAYNYGVYFLSSNGVDEAEFKSLCLVCHLDGIKNSEYPQHINDDVIMKRFADLLWRVKSGEPLQYVIGKWDFFDSEFYVGKGVLIPRPETEELVEKVIEEVKSKDNCIVYDLCSGSGCIGISVAKACPNATVYLVEKSADAMFYLLKNAQDIDNAKVICADIKDKCDLPNADIIVSNPPYIKTDELENLQSEVQYEPKMALDGGKDGLDFYRIINDNYACKLNGGGTLFLEIGNDQGDSIKSVLTNFDKINVYKDIYGNDRIVKAKLKG